MTQPTEKQCRCGVQRGPDDRPKTGITAWGGIIRAWGQVRAAVWVHDVQTGMEKTQPVDVQTTGAAQFAAALYGIHIARGRPVYTNSKTVVRWIDTKEPGTSDGSPGMLRAVEWLLRQPEPPTVRWWNSETWGPIPGNRQTEISDLREMVEKNPVIMDMVTELDLWLK